MNDHSALLKDARELANKLGVSFSGATLSQGLPGFVRGNYKESEWMIRALADAVEAYDKPVAVNAELRAACATCEEEIGKTLDSFDHVDDVLGLDASECWIGLRAARKLAQIAVENHEKAKGGGA